jgi:predicted transcriptional regulator
MPTTVSFRVEPAVKKRLEKLARTTGRSRSFLAAEALNEYLDGNEWQVERIKHAIRSMDAGESVAHEQVKRLIKTWRGKGAPRRPKHSRTT